MSTRLVADVRGIGILGLIVVFAAMGTSLAQVEVRVDSAPTGWKASELIGLSVYTAGDEEKGEIKDLMIGHDGKVNYAAVSFGGFLGIGDKLFAVPWDAVQLESKEGKASLARINVNEESIKERKGFDQDHWPTEADSGFMDELKTGGPVK